MLTLTLVSLCILAGSAEPTEQWAGHQIMWGGTRLPLLGELETRTETRLLAEVTRDGNTLELTVRPCSIDILPVAGVKSRMSKGTTVHVPPSHYTLTYDEKAREYVGIWDDAWTEADLDKDGHPGVTIHIDMPLCGGDVYMAAVSRTLARASRFGSGIVAELEVEVAQRVLGTSNPCLDLFTTDNKQKMRGNLSYVAVPEKMTCREGGAWPVSVSVN